jgi:hypothetical protein
MSAVDFSHIPDDARVWVFAASRDLTPQEQETLLRQVSGFVDGWVAHGHPVVGAAELRHGRFLLLAADERATGVSGCSIDSMTRALRQVDAELGAGLLDTSARVFFRGEDGEVRSLSRPEFRELARAGGVDGGTVVFDNTVATVGDVRHGQWEKPLHSSWHAKAFLPHEPRPV